MQISEASQKRLANRKPNQSIYECMTPFEGACLDYEEKWKPGRDQNHQAMVENFYLTVIPMALAMEKPNEDALYVDCSPYFATWHMPKGSRTISAIYTQRGIRRIYFYFVGKIIGMKTEDDFLEIESELIYCPHLHIKLKQELIDWLSSKYEYFVMDGVS
jgi:hypothetical protein